MSIQLNIHIDEWAREATANRLFELGATGIVEEENGPVGYFNPDTDLDKLRADLECYLDSLSELESEKALAYRIACSLLKDENWEKAWRKGLSEQHYGKRLSVCPTWIEPKDPTRVILRLDPGHAFGTGTHESTRLLLEWLDERESYAGLNILDAGCGTGVLALAALKLGADFVMGIDIEEGAITSSRENAKANGCSVNSFFKQDSPRMMGPEYRFDIVLANIQRSVIQEHFADLLRLMKDDGELWVAGILAKEEQDMLALASEWGLPEPEIRRLGEWIALKYKKPAETKS
jgi:ribosomal protein L11 methyltransferase